MGGLALAEVAWPAIDKAGELTLVVPLGSCEQHGPHLPFDVDSAVAQAVSVAYAEGASRVALGPILAYGASGEHEAFPGTVSIGTDVLSAVLVEIGRSASRWATRVLFVTGHGGNTDALVRACALLRSEGRTCAWWACGVPGGDAHAGATETSLMLALRPDAVSLQDAQVGRPGAVADLLPALRLGGVRALSPSGVLGDPRPATAEAGQTMLAELLARLVSAAAAWQVGGAGQLVCPPVAA